MPTNPIQYTSRTFESILNDINSDNELIDKPDWFKRFIAGIGDVISMWNNAIANNVLLKTAFTRRNVQLLLELIDYSLNAQSTSSGTLIFYLKDTVSFPFTVNKSNLVAITKGTIAVSSKRFEARNNISVTEISETFTSVEVNVSTDVITVTREYTTGEKVRLTTNNTLPSPLAIDTNYYVIKVSSTEIRLSESLTNAYNNVYIDITDGGLGTQTVTLYSIATTCYQQTTKEQYSVGTSDGVTEFQEYTLKDENILEDTLVITINSLSWLKQSSLIDSSGTDRHFRIFFQHNNSLIVQFGNNTYGMIPPAFDIYVSYAYGGGSDSNISSINSISVYAGTDNNIEGVSNPTSFTGGGDEQSIENAKKLGPLLLKSRNKFIDTTDGQSLAVDYGGISLCKVIPNEYGVLSCKVVCVANGGGNLSSSERSALQAYLLEKTILEQMDVRVVEATITSTNVTSAGKVLSGYTWSGQVENRFRLAWKLLLSESGQEILDYYESNGIDKTRGLINSLLSESFTDSENDQITNFLDNFIPRNFGDEINVSDVYGFIDTFTIGLQYMTITSPSLPLSLSNDEITTPGTLNLSEIT